MALKKLIRFVKLSFIFGAIIFGIVAYTHNVSYTLSNEDMEYSNKYLALLPDSLQVKAPARLGDTMSYEDQILLIEAVQAAVLQHNPVGKGIPDNQPRNPKDLYNFGAGLCFDRSYTLEKIFLSLGFKVRHMSLYADMPNMGLLAEMTKAQIPSHAVSEVKTAEGWLIVDSNNPWLGLDQSGKPHSMKTIKKANYQVAWKTPPAKGYDLFYSKDCTYIYGLFSRHGRFYPPYNPVPDVRWVQLFQNL
jgi:hypothetical protein